MNNSVLGLLNRFPIPFHIIFAGGTVVAVCTASCTANTVINADLAGRGAVPANPTEVGACKQACTTRASCANANPSCETLCLSTSSDDAVAFKKCVDKSACDPACDAPLENPPKPDASTPDASTPDATADAEPVNNGLAACLAACNAWQVLECTDGAGTQCASRCNAVTATARNAFATCTSAQTTCPGFMTQCWAPFVPAP
jgi:hypothetical protein